MLRGKVYDKIEKMEKVFIERCSDYNESTVAAALDTLLGGFDALNFVKPGMKIVLKANLVAAAKPEKAATTHPALLCALTRKLTELGAQVIVGDSPGGLFNAAYVGRIYNACKMKEVEKAGASLNSDFGVSEADFPQGKVLKKLIYTSYLDNCDAIIDVCKLKSHGMMGMSAAVKNMFGAVPGVTKPEYHFKYPDYADFANVMIDINMFFKDKLKLFIVDAVDCMEGNGPTAGDPRRVGALLASRDQYSLDLVCAELIGLESENIPTLQAASSRGLCPEKAQEVETSADINDFKVEDFKHVATLHTLTFSGDGKSLVKRLFSRIASRLLRAKPKLAEAECVGCGVCRDICPAKAIVIKDGKAQIDRSLCIRCFCCQEFCPKGAMKVKRTIVARVIGKI